MNVHVRRTDKYGTLRFKSKLHNASEAGTVETKGRNSLPKLIKALEEAVSGTTVVGQDGMALKEAILAALRD